MNIKLAAVMFAVLSLTVGLPTGPTPSPDSVSPGEAGPTRMVEGSELDRLVIPALDSINFLAEPEDPAKVRFAAEPEDPETVCYILVAEGPVDICEPGVARVPAPLLERTIIP